MRFLAKRTTVMAALLAVSMAALGTGMLAGQVLAGDQPRAVLQEAEVIGDPILATWVEKRIQEWQVTAAERPFDEIGWAKDIREALRLAKKHGRSVFLFTHDGRMAIGRC